MRLNEHLAGEKRRAYEALIAGQAPDGFEIDLDRFLDLKDKGRPTMGTTVLKPFAVSFEFIYSLDDAQTEVLSLTMVPPERIVCLPVPGWVVESIWQGEVQGSFHFESDARRLVEEYASEIEPGRNEKWFEKPQPKRRE